MNEGSGLAVDALARIFHSSGLRGEHGSFVAQVSNLLCRRLPVGRVSIGAAMPGGLETRDTADWKSALRCLTAAGYELSGLAQFGEQGDPRVTHGAVNEQVEVSGVTGVSVCIHRQATNDEEGQPAFAALLANLLEQAHGNGSQRPVMNVMVAGGDEAAEERVRAVGFAQELRVELAGEVEGMFLQLDHFHELAVGRGAAEGQALTLEFFAVVVVEFVAVPVPLVDDEGTVEQLGLAAHHELAGL